MTHEIPSDLRASVELSRKLGVKLYLQDEAAAIATSALLAHVPPAQRANIHGYLTVQEEPEGRLSDSWVVLFFTAGDPSRIAFRARVQPGGRPTFETLDPPESAAEGARLLIRARQAAISALPEVSQPINLLLLPGSLSGHDGVLVYMIASARQRNVAVLGRHWRALVSPDGSRVMGIEPLSKTILEIPLDAPDPPGRETAALMITHLVTEHPLETHVFASLLHRKQIYVGTSRGLWFVDGDEVSFLGRPRPASQR